MAGLSPGTPEHTAGPVWAASGRLAPTDTVHALREGVLGE